MGYQEREVPTYSSATVGQHNLFMQTWHDQWSKPTPDVNAITFVEGEFRYVRGFPGRPYELTWDGQTIPLRGRANGLCPAIAGKVSDLCGNRLEIEHGVWQPCGDRSRLEAAKVAYVQALAHAVLISVEYTPGLKVDFGLNNTLSWHPDSAYLFQTPEELEALKAAIPPTLDYFRVLAEYCATKEQWAALLKGPTGSTVRGVWVERP